MALRGRSIPALLLARFCLSSRSRRDFGSVQTLKFAEAKHAPLMAIERFDTPEDAA
jgi:hypothetical protein